MRRWTVTAAAAFLLIGCTSPLRFKGTPEGNQTAPNLDEAGSVHISVIAVTPWNEIKTKLRPNLQIDTKTLREQAIPVTFTVLDKYLEILRLQAALAPGTVKTTSISSTAVETGKDDIFKSSSTTTKAPGEPRATTVGESIAPGATAAGSVAGATAINSSLTARAMASFIQDVQALNAEVDAAAKRTGYVPYLMRIQVSVMPRRRHLGYDVYSNLSFFGYKGSFDPATGSALKRSATSGTPFIVPLLSSDSIETAQRSQSIEALKDVGIALDLIKGVGSAGIAAGSQRDRQQALQGLDVNSVLTMGRISDNTLRVRFGAAFDPGGGFAVHPRTNTISVLVFFPKDAQLSRVVSRNSWTHVLDGTVLEPGEQTYESRLQAIASQWTNLGLSINQLKAVDELALEGNYAAFEGEMDKTLAAFCRKPLDNTGTGARHDNCPADPKGAYQHALMTSGREGERERTYAYVWAHLLSVLPGGRFSTTVVDLPSLNAECPVGLQLAAYAEDDKGLAVVLGGGRELAGSELESAIHWAYMAVPPKPKTVELSTSAVSKQRSLRSTAAGIADIGKPVPTGFVTPLMATGVSVSEDRKTTTLAFASNGIEPLPNSAASTLQPVAVELHGCRPNKQIPIAIQGLSPLWNENSQLYLLGARIPKKEKNDTKDDAPDVVLSASATNLVLIKKMAKARIIVNLGEKPKTAFALRAVGADITAGATAENVTRRADGAYLVNASGTIDLTIDNLHANQSFDLELRPVDEKNKLGAPVRRLTFTAR